MNEAPFDLEAEINGNYSFEQFFDAIKRIEDQEYPPNPTTGMRVDGTSIEGQQIVLTNKEDSTIVSFKLRDAHVHKVRSFMEKMIDFGFCSTSVMSLGSYDFSDALEFTHPSFGFSIQLAQGSLRGRTVRSAFGVIQVQIENLDEKRLLRKLEQLQQIMAKYFNVKDLFQTPSDNDEREYKRARYAWSHKIEQEDVSDEMLESLELEEVMPGYWTYVQKGRVEKLQEIDDFALFHSVKRVSDLVGIVKNGGLLSNVERFRRGINVKGVQTTDEVEQGGGDSVFTRIIPRSKINDYKGVWSANAWGLVFDNSVMNRTDYWCQTDDTAGSTREEVFSRRVSPEEYFERIAEGKFTPSNEQMFRYGIGLDKIKVVCGSEEKRTQILSELEQQGIKDISGRSLEDFIIVVDTIEDIISVSN